MPGEEGSANEDARRAAEQTMILEMTSGAEATGHGFADFKKLEKSWEKLEERLGLLSP